MRAIAMVVAPVLAAGACGRAAPGRDEVRQFVREYMTAVDAGDVAAQLALVSRDSAVTSVVMGAVWRGWDAIHAQAEQYVPVAQRIRSELGGIEVAPLGPRAALAVIPMRSVRREATDTLVPEMTGVLSLVVQREPGGWRMIHEHFSAQVPAPGPP